MNRTKKRFIGFAIFLVLLGIQVHAGGLLDKKQLKEPPKPDLIIVNGMGSTISQIELRPSKRHYGKNDEKVLLISGLQLSNLENLAIFLPPEMKGIRSFDVILSHGEKNKVAKTKNEIILQGNGEVPVFAASIKGKKSTIPIVAGGSGLIAAGGLYAAASYCVATWGAGGLAWLLALPGSMVAGVCIIAVVPVIITVTVYAVWTLLTADTLILTQIN